LYDCRRLELRGLVYAPAGFMVKNQLEIKLKFLVPTAARAEVAAEMSRGSATLERISLAAMYLDTRDRRLAQAGLAWRLRREGRRWIQTLKAGAPHELERCEHEVIRADASYDVLAHARTPAGEQLIALLRRAHADGEELGVRFQTGLRRTARRVRTRGAVVEVALDEGRLMAAGSTQRIREVEFELISGDPAAMLALVERWRKRFGLIYDPRSTAERGDRFAQGLPFPPLRKAVRPYYPDTATATEALGVVVDECLAQITLNAIGLIEGDSAQRVEHVHQLRVGIRRLRSALRSFQGWAPSPPAALVSSLRSVFDTLGMSRDSDVLDSGVAMELVKAGAPPLKLPGGTSSPDPVEAVKAGVTQQTFLAWIAWRSGLTHAVAEEADSGSGDSAADAVRAHDTDSPASRGVSEGEMPSGTGSQDESTALPADADAADFHRKLERRLRRWHERIVADWKAFDTHDEEGLHALRKRIKRQRYAAEFFSPVLRRRQLKRYLDALAVIQDRMGELNDLFVARGRYQAIVPSDPAAWFPLGWLAARIAEARALAKPELGHLAKVKPPAT
jgi:inorganic triphosphatase YgiF